MVLIRKAKCVTGKNDEFSANGITVLEMEAGLYQALMLGTKDVQRGHQICVLKHSGEARRISNKSSQR